MPTFNASGIVTAVEDTFVEVPIPASGAFNAYMIQNLDVGQFRWLSLDIVGSYNGTLSFYGANTTTSPNPLLLTNISTGTMARTCSSINALFTGAINFRYLSVQWTSWTSGSASATLELYYQPAAGNPPIALAFNQGGADPTPAVADNQTQVQRVSIYGIGAGNAGDTNMKMTPDGTVIVNENGTLTTAIAASVTTDTVIRGVPGRLCSILVTTLGTNAMLIYDNASAGSGKVIGIVPASSPVNGIPLTPRMPAALGITVKGNAANPGVTISYT